MPLNFVKIKDPIGIEVRSIELKEKMTLRSIETMERVVEKTGKATEKKTNPSDETLRASRRETKRVSERFNCEEVLDLISDSIEVKSEGVAYYIGKGDKRVFCGPVIQVVPLGCYAYIGGGKSIVSGNMPFEKRDYRCQKDRQVLVKTGKRVGKDCVVVMGKNGCVILESRSVAVFNMPVFVIDRSGQYFYLKTGQRMLSLNSGIHFIVYTKEAILMFLKVIKTKILSELQPKFKTESNITIQPISHTSPQTQAQSHPKQPKSDPNSPKSSPKQPMSESVKPNNNENSLDTTTTVGQSANEEPPEVKSIPINNNELKKIDSKDNTNNKNEDKTSTEKTGGLTTSADTPSSGQSTEEKDAIKPTGPESEQSNDPSLTQTPTPAPETDSAPN